MQHASLVGAPLLPAARTGIGKTTTARQRRNVLYVLFDDLRADEFRFAQSDPKLQRQHFTPTFDKLASESAYFRLAFSQTAFCVPSRASFLTSMRPETTGSIHNDQLERLGMDRHLPIERNLTLIHAFRNAGYVTAATGKIFHFGEDVEAIQIKAPTSTQDLLGRPCDRDAQQAQHVEAPDAAAHARIGFPKACELPFGSFVDQRVAASAIGLLRSLKKRAPQPFLLLAGFSRPHNPYQFPTKHLRNLPSANDTTLAPNRGRPIGAPAFAYADLEERCVANAMCSREQRRFYRGSVSHADEMLGLVLGELSKLALDNSTLVVAHSDHGTSLGENGAWYKRTNFDSSTRVPLFVRAPWLRSVGGITVDTAPVELIDVVPTMLDLAGIGRADMPVHLEGRSLRPLLLLQRKSPMARSAVLERFRYAFMLQPRLMSLRRRPSDPASAAMPRLRRRERFIFDGGATAATLLLNTSSDPGSSIPRECDPGLSAGGFGPGRSCRVVAIGFSVRSKQWRYTRWERWPSTPPSGSSASTIIWGVGEGKLLGEELYHYDPASSPFHENEANLLHTAADALVAPQTTAGETARQVADGMLRALLSRRGNLQIKK